MARALISTGAMLAASGSAQAGVWTLSGRGSAGAEYDDNVRLTYEHAIATTKLAADVAASLAHRGDVFQLQVDPRISDTRYVDHSELNHTNGYLTVDARRSVERSSLALSLTGTQDTTLTSELGSTGLTQVNKRHRSGVFVVSPSFQWTERLEVGGQFYATAHHYVDAEFTGLVDYNYGLAAGNVVYALNERSQLTVRVSAGKLQVPDRNDYDKSNYDATLAYSKQWDEYWKTVLSFGPSVINTSLGENSGTVYGLSATRKSELLNTNMTIRHEVAPNGQGLLSRRDEASLQFHRPLSERTAVRFAGSWVRNRNVLATGDLEVDAVRYADVSASLDWKPKANWSLSLTVGYVQQSQSSNDDIARRRHAGLSVSWMGFDNVL